MISYMYLMNVTLLNAENASLSDYQRSEMVGQGEAHSILGMPIK